VAYFFGPHPVRQHRREQTSRYHPSWTINQSINHNFKWTNAKA